MISSYRDLPATVDSEPVPEFRTPMRLGRCLLSRTVLTTILATLLWHFGRIDAVVQLLLLYYLPLVISVVLTALYAPLIAWLDRRYARKVATGIAELEARAAR